MQRKWNNFNAKIAKKCANPDGLVFVMVSATLTTAVQRLAVPVMRSAEFELIDADGEHVLSLTAEAALETDIAARLRQTQSRGKLNGVISFEDTEDATQAANIAATTGAEVEMVSTKAVGGTALAKGEVVEAPALLSQYYMLVTSKWRLAALTSFLYTHRHMKTMVFFATCDSVDFHALLLRQACWPLEAEPDFKRTEGAFAPRRSSSSSSSSSSGNWLTDDSEDAGGFAGAFTAPPTSTYAIEGMDATSYTGMLGPDCHVFRLHGNMAQKTRLQVRYSCYWVILGLFYVVLW